MQRPPQVALPPQAHAGTHQEGQQRLVRIQGSLGAGGGGRVLGQLSQGPRLQQPLQARHVLTGQRPPVALSVGARAAAAPGRQVGGAGEGAAGEQEHGAGAGVGQLEGRDTGKIKDLTGRSATAAETLSRTT